jgi:Meckel syndrome type 1 protein
MFVRYHLYLPPPEHDGYEYTLEDSTQLVSATQAAIPMEKIDFDRRYFAHYDFPFEFHFKSEKIPDLSHSLHHKPRLFFEVVSRDFWDRYRIEGYGQYTLPTDPVMHDRIEVHVWKPKESLRNEMKSFFVGGSSELDDITYAGVPNDFNEKFINKFGLDTETSGTIVLQVQVVVQRKNKYNMDWSYDTSVPSATDIERLKQADQDRIVKMASTIAYKEVPQIQIQQPTIEEEDIIKEERPSTATTFESRSSEEPTVQEKVEIVAVTEEPVELGEKALKKMSIRRRK